ncbi:4Fe-4S binding protein [candidate division KSB1 bacterium]|nr:4Fe-4S binding protein [candidate division KSB1 bacterium]
MFLPKLREVKEALGSLFSAPYTTKFPAIPFEAHKAFRGKPRYNENYCVGCGTCAQVCPTRAIDINDDKKTKIRTLTVNYLKCMNCGQCEEKCITEKGIVLSNEHSLAVMQKDDPALFEKVDKSLAICESCGDVIACRDHLVWIKDKLGAKAYSHPNLLLETQRHFTDFEESKTKSIIRREDQIKLVCPRCRHKIVVADEFY